jgi:hypothetical protein
MSTKTEFVREVGALGLDIDDDGGGLERTFEYGFGLETWEGATHSAGVNLIREVFVDEIGEGQGRGVVGEDDGGVEGWELAHGEALGKVTDEERVFVGKVVFA